MLGGLADHPHRAAGKSLAEHHARGPGLDHGVQGFQHFVRGAGDVRGEDQPLACRFSLARSMAATACARARRTGE